MRRLLVGSILALALVALVSAPAVQAQGFSAGIGTNWWFDIEGWVRFPLPMENVEARVHAGTWDFTFEHADFGAGVVYRLDELLKEFLDEIGYKFKPYVGAGVNVYMHPTWDPVVWDWVRGFSPGLYFLGGTRYDISENLFAYVESASYHWFHAGIGFGF